MKHASITLKFTLVIALVVGLLGTASYFLLDNVYRLQMRNQANTVADNVTSFGSWVAKYGRVWVSKNSEQSFLGKQSVINANIIGDIDNDALNQHAFTIYSKNPALAQREFSEVIARSGSPATFRLTSDNFMNPLNRPDEFEATAIANVKQSGAKYYETFDTERGEYRFGRAVIHKATCIKCHGDPKSAPADVIARYGQTRGFGFKTGDVAGIISVRIPLTSFSSAVLPFFGWKEAILVLLAFVIGIWFLRTSVLAPIQRLSSLAESASEGLTDDIDIGNVKQDTSNEVEKLGLAIKRLNASTNIALDQMQKAQSKK